MTAHTDVAPTMFCAHGLKLGDRAVRSASDAMQQVHDFAHAKVPAPALAPYASTCHMSMRRSTAGLTQSIAKWQTCLASCRRSCWHSLHPGPSSVLVEVPGAHASGVSGRDPHLNRPLAGHVAQAMNRSAAADIDGGRPCVGRRIPSAPMGRWGGTGFAIVRTDGQRRKLKA